MTSPRLLRRALPAALCALAVLPAVASADSLVFVKDANVWLAHADGSGAYQVTLMNDTLLRGSSNSAVTRPSAPIVTWRTGISSCSSLALSSSAY